MMDLFDKYLYLFDYWTVDLIKPFEDDFFTNTQERVNLKIDNRKVKFIEFVKDDKTLISFQFNITHDNFKNLKIYFELTTFIKSHGYTTGHNEYYLYHHKDKIKEIITHLQERIMEIKKVLHENEGHRVRFAVGIDLFDVHPNLLEESLQSILNTTESEYRKLEKRYFKLMLLK